MKARRRSWLGLLIVVAILTAGCSNEDQADTTTTSTVASPPQTSSTTTVTTTTSPPETTTTSTTQASPAIEDGSLPISTATLVYGEDGIIAITNSGGLVRLSDAPTAAAFAVGDAVLVSQRAGHSDSYVMPEGPILVERPGDQRSYPGLDGEDLVLLDAGVVDGTPVALIGASTGGNPDDKNQQLLLLDLETFDRADLGSVGWWEAGVSQAQLVGDIVVMLRHISVDHELEARTLDGSVLWSFDTGHPDSNETMVATDTQVLLLHTRFEGDDFIPFLDFDRFDLTTGELVKSHSIEVDAGFGGGFCRSADWNGSRLLCNESYGGPFELDLSLGTVTPITSLDDGTPSVTISPDLVQLQASQSAEDALRDGIVPELAALPIHLRIQQQSDWAGATLIETDEGIWMVSVPSEEIPGLKNHCLLGDDSGVYGSDFICTFEYGEILLLDGASGAILKAYPFVGMDPRSIMVTEEAVYCLRQGDGGLPDSMICRIDRSTLDATVRIFPSDLESSYASAPDWRIPDYWTINEPASLVLYQEMEISDEGIRINGHSGTALVDPDTLELYDMVVGE